MKPTIGRIVIYRQPEAEAPVNGVREHPAVITRVWGDGEAPAINCTVFFDARAPEPRISVLPEPTGMSAAWRWPGKV